MSIDIETRRKAIAYWNEGHSRMEVAAKFGVSESTLHAWRTQLNQTGSLVLKRQQPRWKKTDPGALIKYVEKHPEAELNEVAENLGMSRSGAAKALARLGIKKVWVRNIE